MRFHELIARSLTEASGNLLYHGTTVENFYEIVEADTILAKTGHRVEQSRDWAIRPSDIDSRGYISGVSLSRNAAFVRKWVARTPAWNKGGRLQGVVLVLDGDALRHRFRIIPVAFFGGRNTRHPESGPSRTDESEEFLLGDLKPLKRYLIEIQVSKTVLEANDLLEFAAEEYGVKIAVR